MKLVTFKSSEGRQGVGLVHRDEVYDLLGFSSSLPATMQGLLDGGPAMMDKLRKYADLLSSDGHQLVAVQQPQILPPVPRPASFRDAYAFRQHVETSRRNRGLEMIPEFDAFPVFYFSNHQAIIGPGRVPCMPLHFDKLDFELEIAVVLNKRGINIPAEEADDYIAGYMIMNDFSARSLQMEEMKLNLGPAKGKDFATSIGPWLVTPDELAPYLTAPRPGHVGRAYSLAMEAWVNGALVSSGNMSTMHWTFAEIIERVSYGVEVMPGDLIGSGTVGTGCFLELNGTASRGNSSSYEPIWLNAGDIVSLAITGLGTLTNEIVIFKEN